MPKELTNKQQAFIQEYCSNGYNAAAAYRIAYPDCKAGHNALGARLIANDSIKQAIAKEQAKKQAKADYDYDTAIAALDKVITNLTKQAENGNIQANQALTGAIREKNAITGLHKQTIQHKGDVLPQPTEAQGKALDGFAREYKLRLTQETG